MTDKQTEPQDGEVFEYRDYAIEYDALDGLYSIRQLRDEHGEYKPGAWVSISRWYEDDSEMRGCGGTGAVSFENVEQCKAFIDMRHRTHKKIHDFLATVEEHFVQ